MTHPEFNAEVKKQYRSLLRIAAVVTRQRADAEDAVHNAVIHVLEEKTYEAFDAGRTALTTWMRPLIVIMALREGQDLSQAMGTPRTALDPQEKEAPKDPDANRALFAAGMLFRTAKPWKSNPRADIYAHLDRAVIGQAIEDAINTFVGDEREALRLKLIDGMEWEMVSEKCPTRTGHAWECWYSRTARPALKNILATVRG